MTGILPDPIPDEQQPITTMEGVWSALSDETLEIALNSARDRYQRDHTAHQATETALAISREMYRTGCAELASRRP